MIKELLTFWQNGVYPVEASNVFEWYFNPKQRRLYYLAPHWLTSSMSKANEIGYGKYRLAKYKKTIKLESESGYYS